jgi:hypothetical protein
MIRLALVLLLVSTTLAVAQISSLVWPGPGTVHSTGGGCSAAHGTITGTSKITGASALTC